MHNIPISFHFSPTTYKTLYYLHREKNQSKRLLPSCGVKELMNLTIISFSLILFFYPWFTYTPSILISSPIFLYPIYMTNFLDSSMCRVRYIKFIVTGYNLQCSVAYECAWNTFTCYTSNYAEMLYFYSFMTPGTYHIIQGDQTLCAYSVGTKKRAVKQSLFHKARTWFYDKHLQIHNVYRRTSYPSFFGWYAEQGYLHWSLYKSQKKARLAPFSV